MAREYAERVASVFVYTREAHPGESYPAHDSFERKLANARDFVERWNVERPMLVDDFDGTLHHAYGLLPNMTYIVSPAGRVVFRADWTDARLIGLALDQLAHESSARKAGGRLVPFNVEWMPQRVNELEPFMEGLLVAGPRAVEEFIAAAAAVRGPAAARPMQTWWDGHRSRR